jgi:hypothetical protein
MLKLTRVSDFGAGTPAVARLGPGIHEIVGFSKITKESRDRVCACTWDVMQLLVPAQRLAKEVVSELDEIEARLRRDGILFQNFGRVVEVPSAMKLDKAGDFIVRAKKVLARAMELIELFWGKGFAGAHYHKVLEWARATLGPDAPLTRMLDDDQKWIKHIIDLRNEEEHPSGKGPFIRNYDVNVHKDGQVELTRPRFFDGTDVDSALTVFSEDLLTFVEELVALGVMHTFFMPYLAIAEIPLAERDPTLPVRFRVTWNEEGAHRFARATRFDSPDAAAPARVPENPTSGDRQEPDK